MIMPMAEFRKISCQTKKISIRELGFDQLICMAASYML